MKYSQLMKDIIIIIISVIIYLIFHDWVNFKAGLANSDYIP